MSKQMEYISAYVLCPYYKHEMPCKISCEGVLPNTSNILTFQEPRKKKEYKLKFCENSHYTHCRIKKMLDTKYMVEDEEDI